MLRQTAAWTTIFLNSQLRQTAAWTMIFLDRSNHKNCLLCTPDVQNDITFWCQQKEHLLVCWFKNCTSKGEISDNFSPKKIVDFRKKLERLRKWIVKRPTGICQCISALGFCPSRKISRLHRFWRQKIDQFCERGQLSLFKKSEKYLPVFATGYHV